MSAARKRQAIIAGGILVGVGCLAWLLNWMFLTNPDMTLLGRGLGERIPVSELRGSSPETACDALFDRTAEEGSYSGYTWGWIDRRSFVDGCVDILD